ncbi:MAG: PAS-domain containing protein [Alphaproteobacteria bacterium]
MSHIVIIDDRVTNRNILVRLAQSLDKDVDVRAFSDPQSAIEWFADRTPDLVVTDYKMPSMDGDAFIREFRRLPFCFDVPVMVVTAYEDRDFRYRALDAGATDFLLSPVDHNEFRARGRNLLTLRKQQDIIRKRALTLEQKLRVSDRMHRQAIHTSTEMLRLVVNTVPAMICATDDAARVEFINDYLASFFAIDPSAAIGKTLGELIGLEYGKRHTDLDRRVIAAGRTLHGIEETVTSHTGEQASFLTTKAPLRDAAGRIVTIVSVSLDITERRERERLLHEKSLLLRATTDSMAQGMVAFDAQLNVQMSNHRAIQLLAVPEGMLRPGGTFQAVIDHGVARGDYSPGEAVEIARRYHQMVRRGVAFQIERERSDGTVVEIRGNPMSTGGAVVTYTDITEIKRVERELRHAKETAERANQAKSEFLAHMSHELKTPLNAIMGFAELMKSQVLGPLGNPRYREYCSDIFTSGGHLLNLVNDVLELSKLQAGQLGLIEAEIDVGATVEAVLDGLRVAVDQGKLGIEVRIPPGLPLYRMDVDKFRQVLINLISNAIKFTPEGGRISIGLCLAADRGLRIEIADNGVGIPADILARVQHSFGHPNVERARARSGSGLGLPLAIELSKLHGGRCEIESRVGEGTTVVLWFPPERAVRQLGIA